MDKKKTAVKKPQKKWTEVEEIEIPNLYLTLNWSVSQLAKRYACSAEAVRKKLREMGIEA
jgi:hypothetical protein